MDRTGAEVTRVNGYQFILALFALLVSAYFSWRAANKSECAMLNSKAAEAKATEAAQTGIENKEALVQNARAMDGRLSELLKAIGAEKFNEGVESGKQQQKVIHTDLDAARAEQPPPPAVPQIKFPKG